MLIFFFKHKHGFQTSLRTSVFFPLLLLFCFCFFFQENPIFQLILLWENQNDQKWCFKILLWTCLSLGPRKAVSVVEICGSWWSRHNKLFSFQWSSLFTASWWEKMRLVSPFNYSGEYTHKDRCVQNLVSFFTVHRCYFMTVVARGIWDRNY